MRTNVRVIVTRPGPGRGIQEPAGYVALSKAIETNRPLKEGETVDVGSPLGECRVTFAQPNADAEIEGLTGGEWVLELKAQGWRVLEEG